MSLKQDNQSTTRCDNDYTDDEEEEEEDSAVEMGPAPHLTDFQGNPDADADGGGRGGSVDSIDTLSSSVDHNDPTTTQTTQGAGGKDQRWLYLYWSVRLHLCDCMHDFVMFHRFSSNNNNNNNNYEALDPEFDPTPTTVYAT